MATEADVKSLIEKIGDSCANLKAAMESKADTVETKQKIEGLNGEINSLKESLQQMKVSVAKSNIESKTTSREEEVKAAYNAAITKAFSDTRGGICNGSMFLVDILQKFHTEYVKSSYYSGVEIPTGQVLLNPTIGELIQRAMREVSTLEYDVGNMSTSSTEVRFPFSKPTAYSAGSTFTGNTGSKQISTTDFMNSFGVIDIHTAPQETLVGFGLDLLREQSFDVVGHIISQAAEVLSMDRSDAIMRGDGVNKPFGILKNTLVTDRELKTGSATAINLDSLITAINSVKRKYRIGGQFRATRSTISQIRLLKDTLGRPIFNFEPTKNYQETIMGYPLIEDPSMDEIGSGKYPIVFGNFSQGYKFVRGIDYGAQVLPVGYGEKPGMQFTYIRTKVGGDVAVPEAFTPIVCKV